MNIIITRGAKSEGYHVTLPCQRVDTHEGGLNTASVEIRHITRKEPFEPFSFATFDGETWVVDSDQVTYEPMIKRYTHNVSLCEEAKYLEKLICGAKTFSKPKNGEMVDAETALAEKKVTEYQTSLGTSGIISDVEYPQAYWSEINHVYTTPSIGSEFTVRSYKTVFPGASYGVGYQHTIYYSVSNGGAEVASGTITKTEDEIKLTALPDGAVITLEYKETYATTTGSVSYQKKTTYTFTIGVKESAAELIRKPLTVFEVANRLVYTYEAHTMREEPEIRISGMGVDWVGGDMVLRQADDIECPEMSFTSGASLKENLDQLGVILHAKVRMKNKVVYFERLTKQEQSSLPKTEIDGADSFTSEKYGGEVQTFAQNVVNYNDGTGTVTNLFAKTLRTEEGSVRIGDNDSFISTEFPIEKIVKVVYVHKVQTDNGEKTQEDDITDKVVESTYYNTLSSYNGTLCKAQYIYYTQGQPNIKGLFFKASTLVSGTGFDKYAIQNVIGTTADLTYKDLLFKVTYIPICNIRASVPRPDGKGGRASFPLNQSESRTDANRIGRKMYATAVQLTSNSPQKTYIVPPGGTLPTVGKRFDKDNYISQMAVQHFPTYTKCTISISENYNRLSDYVAVPQAVRQYEIDINNVQERHVLYKDWCIIGFSEPQRESVVNQCCIDKKKRQALIVDPFAGTTADMRAKAAVAITYSAPELQYGISRLDKPAGAIASCLFPVIAIGLGNSLLFSFRYSDNFSAGSKAVYSPGIVGQANEQQYVTYSDRYGNAELLEFGLVFGGGTTEDVEVGRALPEKIAAAKVDASEFARSGGNEKDNSWFSGMQQKVHLYKDSRETIIVEYQLLFGSEDGVIIGVDYCETNPLVRMNSEGATSWLCFYDHYIDPVQGTTEVPESAVYKCNLAPGDNYLKPELGFSLPNHKAWAIVRGGKFLLGQNSTWKTDGEGENVTPKKLYFDFCHRR